VASFLTEGSTTSCGRGKITGGPELRVRGRREGVVIGGLGEVVVFFCCLVPNCCGLKKEEGLRI